MASFPNSLIMKTWIGRTLINPVLNKDRSWNDLLAHLFSHLQFDEQQENSILHQQNNGSELFFSQQYWILQVH